MFWRRKKTVFDDPLKEPLFVAARRDDPEMGRAHAQASDSIDELVAHVHRDGSHTCAIKMRFRDPDESVRLGEDRFVFLWLTVVEHDEGAQRFAARFFEVPSDLHKWHKPGDVLVVGHDDIFDWFVNDDGLMQGGFTMRVARSRKPESERAAFDKYTGVRHWVDSSKA
jgi:uncharacterized protein YegJ (DUF2314 family)